MLKFLIFLLFVLSQSDAKPRQKRIVNGFDAEVGSFPFIASLRYRSIKQHFCGAGIISKTFLITAAHCIKNTSPHAVQVYAGSVDQNYGGTYYDIHVLIVHENYTTKRIKNDIGLIRLIEPMRIGTNMEIINFLPRDLYVYPGYKVTAVGWGLLYYYKQKVSNYTILKNSNRLQHLTGTILSDKACAKKTYQKIGPGEICLDSEDDKTTCGGDSGTPLVYTYGDRNFILGVDSYRVSEDCTPEVAGVSVYTNVSHYLDWIHAHMKEGNEGTSGKKDYSNSKVKVSPGKNSTLKEAEKSHSKEKKSNSQEAEETNLLLKKILNLRYYLTLNLALNITG